MSGAIPSILAFPVMKSSGMSKAVGDNVSGFAVGDQVGVGCLVGSCRTCSACKEGLENYCEVGFNPTYNSVDPVLGGPTFGGYSDRIVVDQHFVLNIPKGMDLAAAAPLLCAGITTYSPLRHWKVGPGQKVGIVGLGGLGHMGAEDRPRHGRESRALHHLRRQDRGRQAPWRR